MLGRPKKYLGRNERALRLWRRGKSVSEVWEAKLGDSVVMVWGRQTFRLWLDADKLESSDVACTKPELVSIEMVSGLEAKRN